MAADRMNHDWRLKWGFPALGQVPTVLPWQLACRLGRDAPAVRRETERFLQQRFAQAGFTSEILAAEDPARGKHRVQVYVGEDLNEARLAEGKLIKLGYNSAFVVAR